MHTQSVFQADSMAITIVVVDDERSVREGVIALISLTSDLQVIGQAADGQEAIRLVSKYRPDVVLMDVRMPVLDGLEATRQIKRKWPNVRVIVFTMFDTEEEDAEAAGADCFVLKGNPKTIMVDVIRQQLNGYTNR
jgi:DNA-binding NarL/FixJ family response regulator